MDDAAEMNWKCRERVALRLHLGSPRCISFGHSCATISTARSDGANSWENIYDAPTVLTAFGSLGAALGLAPSAVVVAADSDTSPGSGKAADGPSSAF
eukprot:PDM71824.1 hypothetical protein PRIPAC_38231 [Pristionchus pacificus]